MNPAFLTIKELNTALDKRKVSSVELANFFIDRLETLGRRFNAVAEITRDLALKQAAASDARRASGKTLGPLDGIPYGAKDLLSVAGLPTRWGSKGHADQVFPYDATTIETLHANGAVVVAKLAMIELAGGGNYNVAGASATGACGCAYDKGFWAGGSSSGSGSATALGAVPYSLGSETAGSIVCPSAFNGLTGYRPTYGRISRFGAMTLSWTLDRVGPMARNLEDAALVFRTLSIGPDSKDTSTQRWQPMHPAHSQKLRIGLLKEDFKGNDATACEKAYSHAVELLKKLGHTIVDVEYLKLPYNEALSIIVNAEQASAHENFIRGPRLAEMSDRNQIAGLSASLLTPATDYLWAQRMRNEVAKANVIWDKCDVIFTPTFYHGAPPIDQPFDKTFTKMGGDSGPSNLLGWPAIAFPIGFEGSLPLGGTVLAPCWREDLCEVLVRDFQAVTDYHLKKPAGL